MGLVACKCPQCSADLEFDESRDFMFCQYCGSKILRASVIQNITNNVTNNIQTDNLNVSAQLDVDTMFYNWLVGQNDKLREDLNYYYADDDRAEFARLVWRLGYVHRNDYEKNKEALPIAYKLSENPRYKPYLDEYIEAIQEAISNSEKNMKYLEECKKAAEERKQEKERREATLIGKIEKIYKIFFHK